MARVLGFVVNPIAGMGGAVGLKGTDGEAILDEAVSRGATASASERARGALKALHQERPDVVFMSCGGDMGERLLAEEGFASQVVHQPGSRTTAEDTREACRRMLEKHVELILFCGGDGTARDVVSVAGTEAPVVGIPAGVKMHSSVFALTPADAADLVRGFLRTGELRDAEVLDVDEEDFRKGVVRATLFGIARVPDDQAHLQPTKASYSGGGADAEADELGSFVAGEMEDGVLYILGPGTTTLSVARALGQEKTPLGVDAYMYGKAVGLDLSERELLSVLDSHPNARIIVTPIGSQGFVFGRGNQQISARVIRAVGGQNIVIIATPTKLRDTQQLRLDTGDPDLDSELSRPVKVVTGIGRRKLMRLV